MKNRLEELRKQRGIKQEDLATALEVSRQTIGSLENGRYNPSIMLAFKIARYFQMSIEEIFIYEEESKWSISKIQKVELFVGVIVLLGGLLTYGLGVHQLLPVPRPDLVVYGTTLIGIILILMGCDIFSKPTKEMQILENDERNIAITNASLANAYKVTLTLLVLVLFALIFMGYMSKVVFFSIVGVIAIGQITWVITARYLDKKM